MAITPLDIRKKTFSMQLRGCSRSEVQNFLLLVANEMEELRKERALLAEKVDEVTAKLEAYEKMERLLQDTLLTAQRATEELRETAKRESETTLAEARVQAKQLVLQAEQEVAQLRGELRQLDARRANMIDEIRGIAHSYLSMVDRHDGARPEAEAADTSERPGNTE